MLRSDKHPQYPLLPANSSQFNDVDEGGLNLGQVGAALRRRALLIAGVTGVVATAAVLKAETDPPIYQGTFEILTKPVTGESKAVADVPQTIGNRQDPITAPQTKDEVKTTIAVLQSRGLLEPVIQKLQMKYPGLDYDYIMQSLMIEPGEQNILQVQYTNPDEHLVRDFLSAIKDAFLEYSLEERRNDVEQAIKFVEKEKQPLEERVKDWQERLRTIRQKNNLVEPAQKSQEVSALIATLTQQQLDNRVQLEQMRAKYLDLQKELAQQPGALASNSLLSDNPRYQKILDQIQQANTEIARRGSVYTDQEEGMQRLYQQRYSMVSMLEQERARVNRDFLSRIRELEARDVALAEKIDNLNGYLRALAAVSRDYDNIQRELKIATDALSQFTAKQQALQIEYSQRLQPWRLLDPQMTLVNEPQAISDSAKRNLALGGLLGLLLGVGAALVVDKLSNVFYTSKDLKEVTGLPLLGVVPLRKEIAALADQGNASSTVQQAARASFFEVFRSLYTNILLLGSDAPIRSLVISSAGQGDGKSTVAVHLALSAAAMGHRVLLVDANLRSPSLHQRVGLMNIQGLTDVISADLDWSNVIERSPLEDNLYVLSAGPIPPDSIRLLASQKMQDLMQDLHSSFDLVIYDTPPLVGFADATLLAANTNGMVLVAGLGKVKRSVLQQALEELQISGTPVLGLIANKSRDSVPASYSYYQQYYRQGMSVERIGDEEDVDSSSASAPTSLRQIK
ncbi:MAG: polysaccharide biosynthesis tyrosine autokinase [Fischerella sp.]|jgi:capsular exopolysaccharide synthesis family protein|uniref:GumC family protein n=1 Tax=Fischerella sp. TaxID=1191 RepID=UPI00178F3A86|nr:polysaccharide biosynthesis tyrosine autokinase [Fischerella sp.]NWF62600.1 polysaccharide biosynthesis tyrosine autokinase [Fischerella sp.]